MKPGPLDLPTIWRGCEWLPITMRWKDLDGDPFDLTLWVPYAQTRSGISFNPVVTDALDGVTQISLTREQTAAMKLGTQEWDWVWGYAGNGSVVYPPIVSGKVIVEQPTTRTVPVLTPSP